MNFGFNPDIYGGAGMSAEDDDALLAELYALENEDTSAAKKPTRQPISKPNPAQQKRPGALPNSSKANTVAQGRNAKTAQPEIGDIDKVLRLAKKYEADGDISDDDDLNLDDEALLVRVIKST